MGLIFIAVVVLLATLGSLAVWTLDDVKKRSKKSSQKPPKPV
jgi:hypothetical protein